MDLQDYLESDRQWPRELRIGHAKYQMELSRLVDDKEQVKFWESVFDANTRQSEWD